MKVSVFDDHRWARVHEAYRAWWERELPRPLIAIKIPCRAPSDFQSFTSNYPEDYSARQIVRSWESEVDRFEYLGDAFPAAMPNFGPGVLAAYLGCELHRGVDTAWFHPPEVVELADLHLQWNPQEFWYQRTLEICRVAQEVFQGAVQISPPDLGGVVDVLASFRPSGGLLTDLYDSPDQVKRLIGEIHQLWFQYYRAINDVLATYNPGYTCWTELLSDRPFWMLQCDFAYMISPAMFEEFALPELVASANRLDRPFYHLDGPGQLDKLDRILTIPNLKGIQWIPGAGQPDVTRWPEVYRKIRDAGKLIQVFTFQSEKGFRLLYDLVEILGTSEGIALIGTAEAHEQAEVQQMLTRFGA